MIPNELPEDKRNAAREKTLEELADLKADLKALQAYLLKLERRRERLRRWGRMARFFGVDVERRLRQLRLEIEGTQKSLDLVLMDIDLWPY